MKLFKAWTIPSAGEKARWIIVDESGKIVNKNPNKEDLIILESYQKKSKYGKRYRKEELLEFLRQFYKENGRPPIEKDFDNNQMLPMSRTCINRFGSWNNALTMAGLSINRFTELTDEKLLEFLRQFYKENGRPPTMRDFNGNPNYPGISTFVRNFGSLEKAKKLVGQDIDSMIKKGILLNSNYKGRLFEIFVLEHFSEKGAVDLSGENHSNYADGICPKGELYDAKSVALINRYWMINFNKCVDHYYLGAFDKDYKNILHVWRVPGDFADGKIYIGLDKNYVYNIENMKEYEITDKFIDIFNNWINNLVIRA